MLDVFKDKVILVVDDDNDIRNYYVTFLEDIFDTVISARSGNEAISILDNIQVDIIITDMNMPNGTGLDVVQYVMKQRHNILCVIVTAYKELVGLCDKSDCTICLTKPVSMLDMLNEMSTFISKNKCKDTVNLLEVHVNKARDFLNKVATGVL